jgi:hypothetical protein
MLLITFIFIGILCAIFVSMISVLKIILLILGIIVLVNLFSSGDK